MPSTESPAFDIPAHIGHLQRMIRYAENKRMAAFLEDLVRKLSDPNHVPTGEWNQLGPWGHTDVNIIPAWIRLDFYDEHRMLRSMSWEQKIEWGKLKERSRKTVEGRHKKQLTKPIEGDKRNKIFRALKSGKWINVAELMEKSGCATSLAIKKHVEQLRKSGHVIRYRRHLGISACRLGETSSEGLGVSELTPGPSDKRLVAVFEAREWMNIETLMAICECPTIHALEQRISRLRKSGYLINNRRNPLTQMREYLLVKDREGPHVSPLTLGSKDQVPAGQPAEIHPDQGVEENLDESRKNNHNARNGRGIPQSV